MVQEKLDSKTGRLAPKRQRILFPIIIFSSFFKDKLLVSLGKRNRENYMQGCFSGVLDLPGPAVVPTIALIYAPGFQSPTG